MRRICEPALLLNAHMKIKTYKYYVFKNEVYKHYEMIIVYLLPFYNQFWSAN